MCDFFSGVITRKGLVYSDGNSNSHENVIKEHKLDDSISVDSPKRNWIRFELVPEPDIFSPVKDWVFRVDESSVPDWVNERHERAVRTFVHKNICNTPWLKAAKKELKRAKKIKWFKPMSKPKIGDLLPLAQEMGKAFKIRGKIKVKLIPLRSAAYSAADSAAYLAARSAAYLAARSAADSAARSAAYSAARSAAYSAARSAAWSATFMISGDVNKEYKINPFKLMVDLWAKGFYCCGIYRKTLTLGYVLKENPK